MAEKKAEQPISSTRIITSPKEPAFPSGHFSWHPVYNRGNIVCARRLLPSAQLLSLIKNIIIVT